MWHAAGFFSSIFLLTNLAGAQFSEGGSNAWAVRKQPIEVEEQQQPLTGIVDELKALRDIQQQYEIDRLYAQQFEPVDSYEQQPQYFDNEVDEPSQLELAKIGADIQNLLKEHRDEEASNVKVEQPVIKPQQPKSKVVDQQKRGQFEFVEFVEPHAAKALKNVEHLDKRAPVSEFTGPDGVRYLYSSNNVLFIVACALGSACLVGGVVLGTYQINKVRQQRDQSFDDFTRYSPAGPGRDLRRGRGLPGSPTSFGDNDLTKAAHLHHYEQTKQKIIGADNGIANDDQSDDEAEDLEEHNFSIYECPGLAMSGDIEVKNPNFEQQHP